MRRRAFITLLGGAAVGLAAAPSVAHGQQGAVKRIGVLFNLRSAFQEGRGDLAAFRQATQQMGWIDGGNAQIIYRTGEGERERLHRLAEELVALAPDVILAQGAPTVIELQRATATIPIVFVTVLDPVGAGLVDSLARPGANITGFSQFEYGLSGKWLELLKQVAPKTTRVAVIRDPTNPSGIGQFAAIQSVAPPQGVELRPIDTRDAGEIERALSAFARSPGGGLIVTAGAGAASHRDLIISLAARHGLPAVYPFRYWVTAGGLICYGPDLLDDYRRAAQYVDRILKGDRPADLPVPLPTKYHTVLNLATAKALGIEVAPSLLVRADEVIE